MAVFSQESGQGEFIVMYQDKPDQGQLDTEMDAGVKLDGLYEFDQVKGASITSLATDRQLSAN